MFNQNFPSGGLGSAATAAHGNNSDDGLIQDNYEGALMGFLPGLGGGDMRSYAPGMNPIGRPLNRNLPPGQYQCPHCERRC